MLSETTIPGTDDWWLIRLALDWGRDLPRLGRLRCYVDGTSMVPAEWKQGSVRETYLRYIRMHRLNVAELSVNARVNRMKPIGFRTAAPDDDLGDVAAMATWKRSNLKVGSRSYFRDAAIYGRAYTLTTGPQAASASAEPLVVPQSPWQMFAAPDPVRPWLTEAALMVGHDPINRVDILTLFRPGYMRQAFRPTRGVSSFPTDGTPWIPGRGWTWVSDPVPLGYTAKNPVIELALEGRKGIFEAHTDTLDRINNTILERSVIMAMQSFRQNAIKGKMPRDYPAGHARAGEAINYDELFAAGPGALWFLGENAEVWQSATTDITPVLSATKDDTRHYAAVTSTPLYILQPDAANGSASGSDLAREGLFYAVSEFKDLADVALGHALGLAFEAQDDQVRAAAGEIEAIWAPTDYASLTDRAQAAASGGQKLSRRMSMEKIWQLTPEEMAREEQYQSDEALEAAL